MRSMVYIYIYIFILCTLLFKYVSKMSIWNHENWIANFDWIRCQNFSLKTKFILGFYFLLLFIYINYIRWVYTVHILYTF